MRAKALRVPWIFHRTPSSGILGGNILENFVVTVDYLRQQLSLSSACEQSGKAIILPMRVRDHVPYCDVGLDNHQLVSALIDTGCLSCR